MTNAAEIKGKGANPHADGVVFRVWAPHAQRVSIIGSFNNWIGDTHPMQAEENGNWYANVTEAHVGDQYKFLLDTEAGEFKRIDPYAREVTNSVGNAVVHDPNFDWAGDDFHLAPWNELVLYEMHIGTFNDEQRAAAPSGFDSVATRLAHLKKLGINHFGPSDLDLWQFDGWSENGRGGIYFYNDDRANTPWGDTRPDYGRGEVRQYILDNAAMWLEEYHVDGLRCWPPPWCLPHRASL